MIGADCNSRILDRGDMKIYPLFGDGAGAVLLAPGSSEQGLAGLHAGRRRLGSRIALPADGRLAHGA